jgi:uncharacterized membrane protein YgcG
MKKYLLFPLILVLACVVLLIPTTAKAAVDDYTLFKNYDVNIVVQENNVLDVTETMTAYFDPGTYHHGIIREIPARLEMNTDEGYKKYNIVVSDISVPGYQTKITRDNNYVNIRIGDPDTYASGEVKYTIKYKYDIGDDKIKAFDFLYFNIIGTEWNADIEKATFTVTLPKSFDASKVWTYAGARGATRDVDFRVDGNVITGAALEPLGRYEGITLEVRLPEGYFTGVRTAPPFELALYIFMGVLVILAFILFLLFGIDKKVYPTVEFYAPDHLTSAEVGYIIDGNVDNKDVVSLIIYWADKGCLRIEEPKKGDITLIKLKDIPADSKKYEASLFYGLFRGGDRVRIDSLKTTFYTTMQAVKAELADSFSNEKRRVFTKKSMKAQGWVSFFTALPFAATIFYAIYNNTYEFMVSGIMAAVALIIVLPAIFSVVSLLRNWRSTPHEKRVGKLIWRLILLALVFFVYWLVSQVFEMPGGLAWAGMIATLLIAWVSVFIRKRTDIGAEWTGKLIGLQNFIEKAEKDRIELLVQENPSYFYNILPFAYVLGVTEKWAKNFEQIGLQPEPPGWYSGYYGMNMFSTFMFMNAMNHSLNSMSTTMVSKPAPQGGGSGGSFGGFGGGGFSGGGFGGGGGGSW